MAQGADGDLADIRYYEEPTPVQYVRDNEPLQDLNANILAVDNKAILARDTADTVTTDLAAHIGSRGIAEHDVATSGEAGFMSTSDKIKLDGIDVGAQVNVIAPSDAIELISRKETVLHLHPDVTTSADGFMTASDKLKLDGIETGAQVNNISVTDANVLVGNPTVQNADGLHSHSFSAGSETFTESVHATTPHAGIPGVPSEPVFDTSAAYNLGPLQVATGETVFPQPYPFTPQCIYGGLTHMRDTGAWGGGEIFELRDVSISGNNGIIKYYVLGTDCETRGFQGAFG